MSTQVLVVEDSYADAVLIRILNSQERGSNPDYEVELGK